MSENRDQKISTEDALNAADKILEHVAVNLEKFLGGNLGGRAVEAKSTSPATGGTGLYSRYTSGSGQLAAADKQMQYAENLVLVKGAQADVKDIMEESAKNTLSSALRGTP